LVIYTLTAIRIKNSSLNLILVPYNAKMNAEPNSLEGFWRRKRTRGQHKILKYKKEYRVQYAFSRLSTGSSGGFLRAS
jgi:hypothetical protein